MDIEVAVPPVDLESAHPVDTPDESPLAAHEAAFGTIKADVPAAPSEAPQGRHRAASQKARPSDVEDIATFTRRLKEAEEAIPIERKDGESERVYNLRRRAEIAELAKRGAQPVATIPPPKAEPTPIPEVLKPVELGAKPTWAQYEQKIGSQYATWGEAQDAYVDARDDWKETKGQAAKAEESGKSREQAAYAEVKARSDGYAKSLDTYVKAHPDRAAAFQGIPQVSPLMLEAIWSMDNAPDVVYTLRRTPGLFDEVYLQLEGKPLTPQSVAAATSWLQSRVQAGTTGSVAPPAIKSTPRPPNPVRTGPITPGDDPPADGSSIADHEKYYGKRRRR